MRVCAHVSGCERCSQATDAFAAAKAPGLKRVALFVRCIASALPLVPPGALNPRRRERVSLYVWLGHGRGTGDGTEGSKGSPCTTREWKQGKLDQVRVA